MEPTAPVPRLSIPRTSSSSARWCVKSIPTRRNSWKPSCRELTELIAEYRPNRDELAATADQAATLANSLAAGLDAMQFNPSRTMRLLQNISADTASDRDEHSAEQIWMALDSLSIAYAKSGAPANPAAREAIGELYKQLENPSAYNALEYAQQMKRVHDSLR